MADEQEPQIDLTALVLEQMSADEKAQLPAFAPQKKSAPPPAAKRSYADAIPDAMGAGYSLAARTMGPVVGAVAAGVGGAAGEGYKQLAKHAGEIGPAIEDVYANLKNPETRAATMQGAREGAAQGGTDALKQGLRQGAIELGGRGVSGALRAGSQGLKTINASPVARSYGLTWKNLATGLGALAGKASGSNPAMTALLGRFMANPASFKLATEGMEQVARLPFAQAGRGIDAYRQSQGEEDPAAVDALLTQLASLGSTRR